MTFTTPPAWTLTVATWVGTAVGFIYITRSAAKKKIESAISETRAKLEASNASLLDSQGRELLQLREEVASLRASVNGQANLISGYMAMIQQRDCDLALANQKVHELERMLAAKS